MPQGGGHGLARADGVAGGGYGVVVHVDVSGAERAGVGVPGDYSQLERGGRGRPLLIYRDPAADFTAYKRIQIDPVAGYIGAHSRLQKIAPEDRQALLDYFHATLRKRLTEDYELVNEPGPGVLRLRVAVTDAQGSKVAMDTLSTVVPVGLALSALEKVA